jgi:hypothetical protein
VVPPTGALRHADGRLSQGGRLFVLEGGGSALAPPRCNAPPKDGGPADIRGRMIGPSRYSQGFYVAGLLASLSGSAGAASLLGPIPLSCEAWNEARYDLDHPVLELEYEAWFMGFVSGQAVIMAGPHVDPLREVDTQSIRDWSEDYCRDHPSSDLVGAARVFLGEHPR